MAVRRATALLLAIGAVWPAGCAPKPVPPRAEDPGTAASSASPPAAPAAPSAVRTTRWTALQAGDCLQDPPPTDPAVVTVTLVDCAQPHHAEVFLRAEIPVNTAVTGTADDLCESGFAEYTGRPVIGGPYTTLYLIDSEQDRTANNPYPSAVICLLQAATGEWLTSSARK